MTRIVDNLLSNAVKYSPRGGNIFVRSGHEGEDSRHAQIAIEDEGAGFSEEDRRHLFGRRERLSARPTAGESSTGLGLFTVHRLVKILKGAEIKLESRPGEGANFVLTLPGNRESGA